MKSKVEVRALAALAHQREDENWAFRCALKQSDISCAVIDRQVRALYRQASSSVRCTECGNCCIASSPILMPADIRRLSTHLGQSVSHFTDVYLKHDAEIGGITFKSMPCPFLSGTMCSVYAHRPADCRSFPHLHKAGFIFRMTQAYSNISVYPIVFNVYEGLKAEYPNGRHNNKLPNQAL